MKHLPLIDDINHFINILYHRLPYIINISPNVNQDNLQYDTISHLPNKYSNLKFYVKNGFITTILIYNKNNTKKINYNKSYILGNLKLFGTPQNCVYYNKTGQIKYQTNRNHLKDGLYGCDQLSVIYHLIN